MKRRVGEYVEEQEKQVDEVYAADVAPETTALLKASAPDEETPEAKKEPKWQYPGRWSSGSTSSSQARKFRNKGIQYLCGGVKFWSLIIE